MTEPGRLDFPQALTDRLEPTVGLWNRLEGRPRTKDFDRALRAEIRDPLWLLTRQWQLGEFRGADAGSPVTATYSVAGSTPNRFRPPNGPAEDVPPDRPLESVAERRPLPFAFGADPVSFDLRLTIGHRWFKLIRRFLLGQLQDFRAQYIKLYPIALPNPKSVSDASRVAHPEVWATIQTIAGRQMDGYLLYRYLKDDTRHKASDGIDDLGPIHPHYQRLNELGRNLVAWFDDLIDQPGSDATWDPAHLEHHFSVSAAATDGKEKVLTAQEYPGGQLDWHAFSIDSKTVVGGAKPASPPISRTVFPIPVRYSGMPLPRWWALEDGRTNFAAVRPDSTDLARLIFLEFALVFSNDWYQLPCDLPAGTLADIQGLSITDVFGISQWITPAVAGRDEDWRRWSMFTLDTIGTDDIPADTAMFLPPSVPKVADGPVLEEVLLVRDEQANLVWGIEQTIPLATGEPRRGSEAAAELLAHRLSLDPLPPRTDPRAPVAYEAMNSVPENWIPFVAVHADAGKRSIRLQRAAMPGVVDAKPVRPRTSLLREGLDTAPKRSYFVNEEEVPPSGTRLTLAYNRTRWRNGRVVVWLSARRGIGRGEASSGLAFDHLVPTPPPAAS
ncbi:hypothetical protein SAMN05421504_11140 [Amycolatopsis xylanica]|uniref:Uncharacterized protein n=1 Tax=Amycolatopsis xylanica TaxID=589385 RepID=A0A1H3RFE2_9PSEU|nr:hypothetical protein [Amycolatopsis xylanica]SDZ24035.1 hypothetical protein SAMN05421504_11140 [Amycolatopsis xylanica]